MNTEITQRHQHPYLHHHHQHQQMKTSSSDSSSKEDELYQKYIPVYKKGYHSKTYHSKNSSTQSFSQSFSQLHKNKHRKTYVSKTQIKHITKHYDKVLVFDLDETLGSFSELQWIWNAINKYHELSKPFTAKQKQQLLKTLIDIYPEFLRPGILPILEYVDKKKRNGECMAVFLYTNNQHPPPWTEHIVNYFNQYLEEKNNTQSFFDQIIRAFKIGQEKIEWMRTSHDKSYDDFIKCTLLPKNIEICFVDNTYFRSMIHPKVYYIQPKSYQHSLTPEDIIQRFVLAETSGILDDYFHPPLSSFPSASSFLFFSSTQIQKNSQKTQVKKFIEKAMEEFLKNKQQRIQQYLKNTPITPSTKQHEITPQQFFENIEIDLYVSNKLMYFIREFFVITTYVNYHTRKHRNEKNIEQSFLNSHTGALDTSLPVPIPIPLSPSKSSIAIDSKTAT